MKFAIVIPALNEAKTIGKVIKECKRYAKRAKIIVVDDGSIDATAKAARAAGATVIRHCTNEGKGKAILDGVRLTRAPYILLMDSDGQHCPADIPKFINAARLYDVAVGDRSWASTRGPFYRAIVNKVIGALLRKKFGINDPLCGFRIVRRAILTKIKEKGFCVDQEIIALAKAAGAKMCNVPIRVVYRKQSLLKELKMAVSFFRILFYAIQLALSR